MIKLIVGLKGSGKTKTLISMANSRVDETNGYVVCIEKGSKLLHEIKYQARLLDTNEYYIKDSKQLYGFVAGIYGSNHDVTDIFIDSALKICGNDIGGFSEFMNNIIKFSENHSVNFVITSSILEQDLPEAYRKYL